MICFVWVRPGVKFWPEVWWWPGNLKFWLWNAKVSISWNSSVVWHNSHSCLKSPWTFWSAPRIATSGQTLFSEHAQSHQKSLIHRLPVKSGKSDGLRIQNNILYMLRKLGLARGCDSRWWQKGAPPLETRIPTSELQCPMFLAMEGLWKPACLETQ